MTNNRYDHENIKNQIDGYMIGQSRNRREEFEMAKEELINNLQKHIEKVKNFTMEDMVKKLK